MAVPSLFIVKKESCFSAVVPVSGWNQCVKWVTPFPSAHWRMPEAIWLATVRSIFLPLLMEARRLLYASSLRNSRAVFNVNTFSPKMAVIFAAPGFIVPFAVVRLSIALNRNEDILLKFTAKLKDWEVLNNFLARRG